MNKVEEILFETFNGRVNDFIIKQKRLVHYTSVNNAFNIIKGKELWMGNVLNMPDSSEIEWGYDLIKTGFYSLNEKPNNVFKKLLGDQYHQFLYWLSQLKPSLEKTFILCFIELSKEEASKGLLPMWRGYRGDGFPVSLNFNPNGIIHQNKMPYLSSVEYYDKYEFMEKFLQLAGEFERNLDLLKNDSEILNKIMHMVVAAILSLKHPCYKSEKEWRMIVNPSLYENDGVVGGFNERGSYPKLIYKLKLGQDIDGNGKTALDLLESITVGPYIKQKAVHNSLESFLKTMELKDCEIYCSNLPERLDF